MRTEQIIAAECSIEKCNYISLHFNTTAERCTEIFPDSLLGKRGSATKSLLRFLKDVSPHQYVICRRYMLFQDTSSSVILLVNSRALPI